MGQGEGELKFSLFICGIFYSPVIFCQIPEAEKGEKLQQPQNIIPVVQQQKLQSRLGAGLQI